MQGKVLVSKKSPLRPPSQPELDEIGLVEPIGATSGFSKVLVNKTHLWGQFRFLNLIQIVPPLKPDLLEINLLKSTDETLNFDAETVPSYLHSCPLWLTL